MDCHTKTWEQGMTFGVTHHLRKIIQFSLLGYIQMQVLHCWCVCTTARWSKTQAQLYLSSRLHSHWFLSLLPPFRWQKWGSLTVRHDAVRDSSPRCRVRPVSQSLVCVCLCACRTISLAQQLQERAQNILFAPFPRQPVHEVLFCVRIWDACMCVCICEHAPCRLCYATDSELTWTWLSACLSYDRGVLSAKTTSPSTQEKQWYLCQWTVVVLLLHEFSFLQFCSSD